MQVVEPNGRRETPPARTKAAPAPAEAPSAPLPYPLVVVEWYDAWFDLDLPTVEQRRADYVVRTVGFLLAEDPRFVSLAQEVLPEGEGFRAVTHIPVAIVKRISRLQPRVSGRARVP